MIVSGVRPEKNFGQAQMEEGRLPPSMPKAQDGFGNQVVSYIDSVSSAVNLIVLLETVCYRFIVGSRFCH